MTYTSFDRLRTALEHKEPDRVPCDFGAAEVAAINIHTMRNLRAHLGLSPDVEMDNKVIQAQVERKGVFLGRMSSGMWEHAMWMAGYEKFFSERSTRRKHHGHVGNAAGIRDLCVITP